MRIIFRRRASEILLDLLVRLIGFRCEVCHPTGLSFGATLSRMHEHAGTSRDKSTDDGTIKRTQRCPTRLASSTLVHGDKEDFAVFATLTVHELAAISICGCRRCCFEKAVVVVSSSPPCRSYSISILVDSSCHSLSVESNNNKDGLVAVFFFNLDVVRPETNRRAAHARCRRPALDTCSFLCHSVDFQGGYFFGFVGTQYYTTRHSHSQKGRSSSNGLLLVSVDVQC
jgi:hypothetical protein